MKLIFILTISFLVFCVAVNAQIPFTCKGQYFLSLTKGSSQSSGLFKVKIAENGKIIYLDTIASSVGLVINAMGYRITDNFIYGVDPNSARLRRVGADGVTIDLGLPKGIPTEPLYFAGDVTPDGNFLLLIGIGGVNSQIVKVDLRQPEYPCTFVPMQDPTVSVVDVAFDPFSGLLYGHDLRNKRMVIIDPVTGAVNINFIKQPQVDQLGALFFDTFGNLYGYGAYGTFPQDKFVSINKTNGEIRLIGQGPLSSGQDGCSCPYTLELLKTVEPKITYPCTEVMYTFIISNGSGAVRNGINLEDVLPAGLKVKSLTRNPFGGKVTLSGNYISIQNMSIPPGVDSIKVSVWVDANAMRIYRNQALLSGLPSVLGITTYSDNPSTFAEKDSTDLFVKPVDIKLVETKFHTCPGDSVWIDATEEGISCLWDDGDNSCKKWLRSPGDYQLSLASACESKDYIIIVRDDAFSVNIAKDTIEIELGEEVSLNCEYFNYNDNVRFFWTTENNQAPNCTDCQSISARPLFSGYYTVEMVNGEGCKTSDKVYVRVIKDRVVFAPNIFTPSAGSSNNVFFLSGKSTGISGKFLKIYDRWGNLIFDSGQFELCKPVFGWDGNILGKPATQGVYTWIAELQYFDGYSHMVYGDITLLR